MKKSAQISVEDMGDEGDTRGFWGRAKGRMRRIRWIYVLHVALFISEKAVQKMKRVFLRMESQFVAWKKYARYKKRTEAKEIFSEEEDEDMMKKLMEYNLEKKKKTSLPEEEEEKTVKPMISDRIVSPRPEAHTKDRLEELLIERIAVNPKDVEAYERLGEYYIEVESYDFAKECFKQVMKLDPSNRNARYKMRRLEQLLSKK